MSVPDIRTVTGLVGLPASGAPTHSALRAQPGEVYVRLDLASPAYPALPALVEDRRWNGWVRPRFRREVTESLLAWLEQARDPARGWHDSGRFEGETLILVETEERYRTVITPDPDGRYSVEGWCWELTVPCRTSDTDRHEAALLADPARFVPRPEEVLVTTQGSEGADPAFPALVSGPDRHGWPVPRFRREIAEAVVAWINATGGGTEAAYWEDDTVVWVQTTYLGAHGYLPQRIPPDPHGRYPISAGTWSWITSPPTRSDEDNH